MKIKCSAKPFFKLRKKIFLKGEEDSLNTLRLNINVINIFFICLKIEGKFIEV